MSAKTLVKRMIQLSGFDLIRFNPRSSPLARRLRLFCHYGIDLVFDVGASTGGYGKELRTTGFKGAIVSFEPSLEAFTKLEAHAASDPRWHVVRCALGSLGGMATLNLAQNSESSSFLPVHRRHTDAYPGAATVGREAVPVRRLDDVYSDFESLGSRPFLKVDTQGFEKHVLLGSSATLPHMIGVQLELSLVPLYKAEPSLVELVTYLQERGFALMSVQPVIDDPVTGQLLQVDGLFFRSSAPAVR